MRKLTRHQVVLLGAFAIWAVLLVVGLVGSDVGVPRSVTTTAGVVAVILLFWFMPGVYLYGLVVERRRGVIRAKGLGALAIRRRWYFAFVGTITVLTGLILLSPSTQASSAVRLAGAVIFVLGLLALGVGVLAFRWKPLLSNSRGTC